MCHFLHPINILVVRPRTCERIAPASFIPFSPPFPSKSSLSSFRTPNFRPPLTLLARLCGCDRSLLKIIYIYLVFLFVFTQATRYFLIILLIDASFLSSFHGLLSDLGRAKTVLARKWLLITDFLLASPQSFGKSPPLVVPPWDPEGPPCASLRFTSSRREEKVPRDILPKSQTSSPFSPPPFRLSFLSSYYLYTSI